MKSWLKAILMVLGGGVLLVVTGALDWRTALTETIRSTPRDFRA